MWWSKKYYPTKNWLAHFGHLCVNYKFVHAQGHRCYTFGIQAYEHSLFIFKRAYFGANAQTVNILLLFAKQ